MTTTTIDCETCPVRGRHCGDCFVPVLGRLWLGTPTQRLSATGTDELPEVDPEDLGVGPPATAALDSDELAAVSAFVRAGLVEPAEADRARAALTASSGYAVG
jgi:hypothetical protein